MNCEIDEMEDGLEVELIDVKSTLNSDNFIKVKDIKSLTKIVEEDNGESGKIDALSLYALSFHRSQNVLGWSKFFVPDQKFVYILWQSQTFCARQKDDLHSVKFGFVSAHLCD